MGGASWLGQAKPKESSYKVTALVEGGAFVVGRKGRKQSLFFFRRLERGDRVMVLSRSWRLHFLFDRIVGIVVLMVVSSVVSVVLCSPPHNIFFFASAVFVKQNLKSPNRSSSRAVTIYDRTS